MRTKRTKVGYVCRIDGLKVYRFKKRVRAGSSNVIPM